MSKEITALRVSQWYDRLNKAILFGIECKINGAWSPLCNNTDNHIRATKEQAEELILEISKELGWEEVGKKKQTPTDPNCLFGECNNPEVCNEKECAAKLKSKSNRL